ncbi:hypothetical protein BLNAU_23879 [Blattamonas nauphoetae]|uniref:Uncharacterized protein n=1 Tax=Blattamonas nauphoetae TaxID=2049346 RepID=A0ABQ9WP02_9EUKA|nr:hypothetical protein BLNAU_23879 [Blattamonas nauphoetae]
MEDSSNKPSSELASIVQLILHLSYPTNLLTINADDRQYIQISKQVLQYEMRRRRINVQTVLDQIGVILQDSITADDLRQGCISLFDQVNTEMKLTPIEVNHAVRFLKYAEIHINHHKHPTTSSSTLYCVKQQAALQKSCLCSSNSFVIHRTRSNSYSILLGRWYISIHKRIRVYSNFSWVVASALRKANTTQNPIGWNNNRIPPPLRIDCGQSFRLWIRSCPHPETLASETMDPIFQPFCTYVQYLLVAPIEGFFDELRKNMTNELASWLDIATTEELSSLLFGKGWNLLLKMGDTVVSSSKLDSKALWTLFTPTQLHHATTILNALRWFLVNAVNPSKLPFTVGFISFHTNIVSILRVYLDQIRDYEPARTSSLTDQLRGELDELSLAFYTQTKDYVVHLSLHPFALDDEYHDTILDFLDRLFRCDCEYNKTRSFRAELRQKMDESAIVVITTIHPHIRTCLSMQLSRVYLPDLFRKAGRSNEQYLHAFESLSSQRRLFGSSTDKVSSLDLAKGTPTSIGRMG